MKKPAQFDSRKFRFSLVEVLIILSVIMLIVTLIQPYYKNSIQNGRTKVCILNHKKLTTAQFQFADDHGDELLPAYDIDFNESQDAYHFEDGHFLPYNHWSRAFETKNFKHNLNFLYQDYLQDYSLIFCPLVKDSDTYHAQLETPEAWKFFPSARGLNLMSSYMLNPMIKDAEKFPHRKYTLGSQLDDDAVLLMDWMQVIRRLFIHADYPSVMLTTGDGSTRLVFPSRELARQYRKNVFVKDYAIANQHRQQMMNAIEVILRAR